MPPCPSLVCRVLYFMGALGLHENAPAIVHSVVRLCDRRHEADANVRGGALLLALRRQ